VPAHSPIPELFLTALNGAADPYKHGVISSVDIYTYLLDRVGRLRDINLTPQHGSLPNPAFAEGKFLFRISNSGDPVDSAVHAWAAVKDSTSIAMLEQFRTLYPSSVQAPFAAARIEELKRPRMAVVEPPVVPAVPPRPAPAPPRTAAVVPPVAPAVPPATIAPCGGGARTVSFSSRCATPLSAAEERSLKPKDTFKECSNCPEMIVVPAGSFRMGSPANEPALRNAPEGPQHTVTFARQFAVGQFEVTFDEWDACVADDGCNGYKPTDHGGGRGRRPVFEVSWNEAKAYVGWLSNKTGKTYRLLTEAEYEYATRAGTQTAYPWGNDIGENNANCRGCGSQWDGKQTAPVGSFSPNGFGLYDMVGNVWEWTEDCLHDNYNGAPTDGSAWTRGDCRYRVIRGGSWYYDAENLRSAIRNGSSPVDRSTDMGFRVGRTLLPP
jgi:formylglycine-generating enzyme required for sulfatase activity